MFDVNRPDTLHALGRWWAEFRERAPVPDEELDTYCAVVEGNKTDLVPDGEPPAVSRDDALSFIDSIVPPASPASSPLLPHSDAENGEFASRPVTLYLDAEDGYAALENDDGEYCAFAPAGCESNNVLLLPESLGVPGGTYVGGIGTDARG